MKKTFNQPQFMWQMAAVFVGGLLLFLAVMGTGTAALHTQYRGRIFPGLRVGRAEVGGQTPQQAAQALDGTYSYPEDGTLLLEYGDQGWYLSPADAGFFFSKNHNAEVAFEYGRSGGLAQRIVSQLKIMRHGVTIPPRFIIDERVAYAYLSRIAEEVNQPPVEASLKLEGLNVIVQPGQVGRRVDIPATIQALEAQMRTLQDGTVPLVVQETRPDILDASAEAEFARQIISQPLKLSVPDAGEDDPGPWVLEPEELVDMLTIQRIEKEGEESFRIALDSERLRAYLQEIEEELWRDPQNARMVFNENTGNFNVLEQEVVGRAVNVNQTIQNVQQGVAEDQHDIPLVMEFTRPEVTDVNTPEELGIRELVSQETTYFRYSSAERIQNIKTAAAKFHGVFVAPGETFSMGEQMGDVSLESGYEEAWIIYGDRTIKGVGGGVCQVSTTLFRTVFFGGYPWVERHPHAYRVKYYEQTASGYNDNLAGLDATVYFPVVDFKFKNDTEHWLLMETYISGRSLTWKFYSTDVGREVNWSTTGIRNEKKPPDPVYEENEDLKKGEIKQVDWAVKGATVNITRDVIQDGETVISDRYKTKYMPWAAVCQYGPGTKGMPPEEPKKNNPCKPDK